MHRSDILQAVSGCKDLLRYQMRMLVNVQSCSSSHSIAVCKKSYQSNLPFKLRQQCAQFAQLLPT